MNILDDELKIDLSEDEEKYYNEKIGEFGQA